MADGGNLRDAVKEIVDFGELVLVLPHTDSKPVGVLPDLSGTLGMPVGDLPDLSGTRGVSCVSFCCF